MDNFRALKYIVRGDLQLKENIDMLFPWCLRKVVRKLKYENYDRYLTKGMIRRLIKKDDPVILEIGANNGRDTREFIFYFKKAKIYCFEPDSRALRKFKMRLRAKRCRLFEIALTDRDGEIEFNISNGTGMKGGWDGSSSIKNPILSEFKSGDFKGKRIIKTKRLDTWTKENHVKDVDFIWSDVQGAEIELIYGAKETLSRTKYFYTEIGNDTFYEGAPSLKKICDSLHGFEFVGDFNGNALFRNKNLTDSRDVIFLKKYLTKAKK